jgi:hypothetical protein
MRVIALVLLAFTLVMFPVETSAQEHLTVSFDNVTDLSEYAPWGILFDNVMIWAVPQYENTVLEDSINGGAYSYPNGICGGNCYTGIGTIHFNYLLFIDSVSIWALSGPGSDVLSPGVKIIAYDYSGNEVDRAEAPDNVQFYQLTVESPGDEPSRIRRIELICGSDGDSWDHIELIGNPVISTETSTLGKIKLIYK